MRPKNVNFWVVALLLSGTSVRAEDGASAVNSAETSPKQEETQLEEPSVSESRRGGWLRGGAQYSFIRYFDSRGYDIFQTGFTVLAAGGYQLSSVPIDLGFESSFNLLPMTTNAEEFTRFLTVRMKGRYRISLSPAVELGVNVGAYYITMITDNARFGFQNMLGPILYPDLRYRMSEVWELWGHVRFSPVSRGIRFEFLPLGSHELSVAAGLVLHADAYLAFGVIAEVVSVAMEIGSVKILGNSYSLGGMVTFRP